MSDANSANRPRLGTRLATLQTHGEVTRYHYPAALYLLPLAIVGGLVGMLMLGQVVPCLGQFGCLVFGASVPLLLVALRYYLKRNIEIVTDDYHLTYCDGRDVLSVHWLDIWEMEQVDTIMGTKQIAWCEVRTKQGRFRLDQDLKDYEKLVRTIIKRSRLGIGKRNGRSILWLRGYR